MSPRAIGGRGSCHVARTWLITASWLVTERCTICWRVNTVLPQSSTRSLSFPGLTTVWSLHDCRDTVQISSVFLSANDQPFVCMRYGCAWIFYNCTTVCSDSSWELHSLHHCFTASHENMFCFYFFQMTLVYLSIFLFMMLRGECQKIWRLGSLKSSVNVLRVERDCRFHYNLITLISFSRVSVQ